MAQAQLPRVLVAGTPESIDLVQLVLGRDLTVVPAQSVEAAVQRLDGSIRLILVNIGFDDSRLFDFLDALREGEYRHVPVLCFRMEHGSLTPAMEKSVDLALGEVGLAAFVDLPALARDHGMDAALAELRRRALAETAGTGDEPPGAGAAPQNDSCDAPDDGRKDVSR